LKTLVKQGAKESQRGCPGEDNCQKFKTSIDDKKLLCERCPQGVGVLDKISEIEGAEGVLPFTEHVIYLDNLIKVGASVQINDLTKEEWDGLILLRKAKNEVEVELIEREKEKQKLKQAAVAGRQRR